MAWIRRTLSPCRNGGNTSPFSPNSLTKLNPTTTTRFASPLSDFGVGIRRFVGAEKHIISSNNPKKGGLFRTWRKSVFGYFLFFLVGFLLGLAPFGELEQNVQSRDFSFEIKGGQVLDVKQVIDHGGVIDKVENIDNVNLNVNVNVKERFDYDVDKKQVIVVTPTYGRALQAFYLNRLGQVLRLVPPPVLWIVVEMNVETSGTADILRGMGIMYRHLVCSKNVTDIKDRGVHQRNRALEHIEHHKLDGIVYFADDDNIYSLELFESLRNISHFGTWPVAMLAQSKNKATLEGPVCNGSQVIGWHTNEKSKRLRRFHVDMSGFAFNSTILWDPKRWKKPTSALIRQLDSIKEGFQETTFIEQLVEDESQMEATPFGCSKIMNWHLHLEAHDLGYPRGWLLQKNLDSVLPIE